MAKRRSQLAACSFQIIRDLLQKDLSGWEGARQASRRKKQVFEFSQVRKGARQASGYERGKFQSAAAPA